MKISKKREREDHSTLWLSFTYSGKLAHSDLHILTEGDFIARRVKETFLTKFESRFISIQVYNGNLDH